LPFPLIIVKGNHRQPETIGANQLELAFPRYKVDALENRSIVIFSGKRQYPIKGFG
jgi:hypothetical protein